jgi:superfamily I DNA/RNA helicase
MPFPEPGGRENAAPGPDRLLADLTPEQAQAVTHSSGPLLLLAGPGAGKTKTLTHRAAYLLATERAQPSEILAVTFSVRAAGELRLRLLSDADRGQIPRAVRECGQPASVEVLAEISRAKNLLFTPESYERSATAHPAGPLIAAVWRETEAELQRSNAMSGGAARRLALLPPEGGGPHGSKRD